MLIVLFALWSRPYVGASSCYDCFCYILWPDHRSQPHFFPSRPHLQKHLTMEFLVIWHYRWLVHVLFILNPSLTVKKNNCSPFVNNGNSTDGLQLLGPSPVYCIIPLTNGIDLDANIVFWVGVGRIKHEFYCNGIQYIGLNCYFESDCYRSKKW